MYYSQDRNLFTLVYNITSLSEGLCITFELVIFRYHQFDPRLPLYTSILRETTQTISYHEMTLILLFRLYKCSRPLYIITY